MTPEQIETALDFVKRTMSGFDYFDTVSMKAFAALEADGEAMQTPITADALVADGWNCVYLSTREYWELLKENAQGTVDSVLSVKLPDSESGHLYVYFFGNFVETYAKTMYDLRELVRLLGGQP